MLALTFRIEEDVRKMQNFRRQGFNKIMKECLKEAALEWHGRFIRHHFTRAAYTRYRYQGLYRTQKRHGDPLVETGSLRDRMTRRRGMADVTGTSKKVTMRLPIGRPPKYTETEIEHRIRAEMKKRGINRQAAQNRVYRSIGYSKQARAMFKTHIPAVAGGEVRALRAFLKARIVHRLNERGPKRTRIIRG